MLYSAAASPKSSFFASATDFATEPATVSAPFNTFIASAFAFSAAFARVISALRLFCTSFFAVSIAVCTPASFTPPSPTVRKDSDVASILTDTTPAADTARPFLNSDSAKSFEQSTYTIVSAPSALMYVYFIN